MSHDITPFEAIRRTNPAATNSGPAATLPRFPFSLEDDPAPELVAVDQPTQAKMDLTAQAWKNTRKSE